ncbi:MAG: translation elongation factor 4 [Candidatus Eisenbacteria sp.]|nr:translation elongation factor 4 [Candidatus Eisenbacteria bacterium]
MDRDIRNFCIIAHIDHGKSTLADRLLEKTRTLRPSQMREQVLDNMELERERGITIKSHAIQMKHLARDGRSYRLNLIDTPGHVDFSYEVSRALAACEGALLVVDAAQGVEAQTVSNFLLARAAGLTVIPVVNKIDLPGARPEDVVLEVAELTDTDPEDALLVSAKAGWGVSEILEAVVAKVPPPGGDPSAPLQALIFDSEFNSYRGVLTYIRVFEGEIRPGVRIQLASTGKRFEVQEVGVLRLDLDPRPALRAGDVGYVVAGIKRLSDPKVGDTIVEAGSEAGPLAGYHPAKPMVFSSFFPSAEEDFARLQVAFEKLSLNDASLHFERESSDALGQGFRCGFLGLLHMEITKERLRREYEVEPIVTLPSVRHRVLGARGEVVEIDSPARFPDAKVAGVEEPFVRVDIVTPTSAIGSIMALIKDKRGVFRESRYLSENRVHLVTELPLSEILVDFNDRVKSVSQGYASFDYEIIGYRSADLVRLDVLLNGIRVDALSRIVAREKAYYQGRSLVQKLRETIPRHMFQVSIQAAVGSRIIAVEKLQALRKDVTAKCYGGDITRKRKLREKQRAGKARMRQFGKVVLPQEAFFEVLKSET